MLKKKNNSDLPKKNTSANIVKLKRKNAFLRFCLILLIVGVVVGLSFALHNLFNMASDEMFWFGLISG